MDTITIREVRAEDAPALLQIYSYYVEHTAITFEYTVPTVEEFRSRIEHTLIRYPYFAAVQNDRIIGYAYAGAFHPRAAYDWASELSIYVDRDCRHTGAGKKLYAALSEALKAMGITNLYACIGSPTVDDEYLDHNSEQFHAHLGFTKIGEFHDCGYKFSRWYNMIWMEKIIGEHTDTQAPVRAYKDVKERVSEKD